MNLRNLIDLQSPPTGIQWDSYKFSEPVFLSGSLGLLIPPSRRVDRPKVAGLYVIMIADSTCSPRPYKALYFGQSDDIYKRASVMHENYEKWCVAASGSSLYVSYFQMPNSAEEDREKVETVLIEKYKPSCNEKRSVALSAYDMLFGLGKR